MKASKEKRGSVPLSLAFAEFLPELWAPHRARFDSDQQAVELLHNGETGLLEYYASESNRPDRHEAILGFQRARELVDELKARLSRGELVATAVQPPSPFRIQVPNERWRKLRLIIHRQEAYDANFRFIEVEVYRGAISRQELVDSVATWLADKAGVSRKVLEHEANERFPDLKTREFSRAYRQAVGPRPPGRPRKSTRK